MSLLLEQKTYFKMFELSFSSTMDWSLLCVAILFHHLVCLYTPSQSCLCFHFILPPLDLCCVLIPKSIPFIFYLLFGCPTANFRPTANFGEISTLPIVQHITINQKITPVATPARKTPIAVIDKLKMEFERM